MSNFLPWLQERVKHRLKPATPTLISGMLPDLLRSRIDLIVENALLRQQLIVLHRRTKRIPLTNPDCFRHVSCPLHQILETIASYCSAGYPAALASGTVSLLLATEVAR